MKVLSSLIDIHHDRNSVITVGTFDGVHLAHRQILDEAVRRAQARRGRSVVITFEPHPRTVVGKDPASVRLLTTIEERISLLQEAGPDILLIVPFTREFSRLTSEHFYKEWVVDGIGVAEVIEGYDHSFGRDAEGGIERLRALGMQYGFNAEIVEPVRVGGEIVGSSRIRKHIESGAIREANALLGRPYAMDGIVVEGKRRGRTLGFPTANIRPSSPLKLIPLKGVYAAGCILGGTHYGGMLNIGTRPTFETETEQFIEIHLFNFSGEIYGRQVRLRFYDRIRDERRFAGREELIDQLRLDAEACRTLLDRHQTQDT